MLQTFQVGNASKNKSLLLVVAAAYETHAGSSFPSRGLTFALFIAVKPPPELSAVLPVKVDPFVIRTVLFSWQKIPPPNMLAKLSLSTLCMGQVQQLHPQMVEQVPLSGNAQLRVSVLDITENSITA